MSTNTTDTIDVYSDEQIELAGTILRQIGRMNILAISGGRFERIPNGVRLPVSNGYAVEVVLDRGSDTYTVRRTFTRSGRVFPHGEMEGVYCDEVGEMAYQAHAFRSYDFPKPVGA